MTQKQLDQLNLRNEIIRLRRTEGYKWVEIAKLVGCSRQNCKQIYKAATRKERE